MNRIIVIPAVFIGCLVVIWVGTTAAANMPSQELLAPTITAAAGTADEILSISAVAKSTGIESNPSDPAHICSLSNNYPEKIRQWCNLIEESAYETGLPAALIAAVILQESGGAPLAYSSSGAVGLMQVMPRDGKAAEFMCINGPCFASRPTIAELQDPVVNIAYGSQLLADLFAQYQSYREALYRYGPMNMGYNYADLVLTIWENY